MHAPTKGPLKDMQCVRQQGRLTSLAMDMAKSNNLVRLSRHEITEQCIIVVSGAVNARALSLPTRMIVCQSIQSSHINARGCCPRLTLPHGNE